MIWVVNTNSNTCHIYNYQKSPEQLSLLKEINHPENKLKTGDYFTSDKPGHYQTSSTTHGAFAPHTDPKEAAIDAFSREIAKELNHGRKINSYNKLILISAPHMNGLVHHHLDKHVKDILTHNIEKDFLNLTDQELIVFLRENTRFPE